MTGRWEGPGPSLTTRLRRGDARQDQAREAEIKRIVVPAAVAATLAAGCGGGGQGQATRPSESFQGEGASGKQAPFKEQGSSSKQSAGKKAPKEYPVNATAVLSVGSGMTVSPGRRAGPGPELGKQLHQGRDEHRFHDAGR